LQGSVRTLGHIGQFEGADRSAPQDDDFVSETSQDAADLAVLSFAQRDIDFGATFAHFANGGAVDPRDPFSQIDTSLKPSHGLLFDLSGHDDEVGLGNAMLWMRQTLCKLSIVGQENQSSARGVQSADRKQTGLGWHQIDHARASFGIAVGAQDAGWFVDGIVDGAVPFQGLAIDEDFRFVGIDFDTHLRDDLAVDFHATLGDQFVDLSTRTETGCGKEFIDPLLPAEKRRGSIGSSFWL
jgi:hypothetical protein